jgi:23S rRNA pseudouridine1911/1915/1917 synthase
VARPDAIESFLVSKPGVRLDRLVADALGCGRRRAADLIRQGTVRVDGHRANAAFQPPTGAEVTVDRGARPRDAGNALVAVRVLWRGDGIVALAKPAGVHSVGGRSPVSVAAFLQHWRPALASVGSSEVESGLVHRLDRDTSGLVLAAEDQATYLRLRADFAARRIEKHYLALVMGRVRRPLTVDRSLARRRRSVVPAGRGGPALPAETTIVPLELMASTSLVLATMRTGVTHQIRAHLALAGHAIVGDSTYGGPDAPPGTRHGQLLHAFRVVREGGPDLSAAVPGDFLRAYASLLRGA